MQEKKTYTYILILYIIAMFVFSSIPQVGEIGIVQRYDKYFHLMEFFLFTLILMKTLKHYNVKNPQMFAVFVGVSLAIGTELFQLVSPLRNFSPRDIWFNITGVGMALISKWI